MTAPAPIRYDPGEPEMVAVCPRCAGEAARQAVHDGAHDIKYGPGVPEQARCEWEERFGQAFVDMADWADEYSEDVAKRDDPRACERHKSGPCE